MQCIHSKVNVPLIGKCYTKAIRTRTKKDWALLVRYISDKLYAKPNTITLVMDNLASHSAATLYKTFPPEEAKGILDRLS